MSVTQEQQSASGGSALSLARLSGGPVVLGGAAFAACIFILVLDLITGGTGRTAAFWLGRGDAVFPYPFTIQNIEHLLFFIAMGELFTRWSTARAEMGFLQQRYLPEDDGTVLMIDDLGPIRRKVAGSFTADRGFLPYLIDLCILQAQASRSVDQTVSVLNATMELMSHRVDLRYQLARYFSWLIPTVGFIGTVVGIAAALSLIDPDTMDLSTVTAALSVAFDTTILALAYSAIIMFVLSIVQKQEELALNHAGSYCLKNLINRLYVGD